MTKRLSTASLFDPRTGDTALRIDSFEYASEPIEPRRTNYFTIYRIDSGSGMFWADAAQHAFGPDSLLFFTPYQHIRFEPALATQGDVIRFHANFLCVETFHAEVGCSGVLFNDPYGMPVVVLDDTARTEIAHLIGRLLQEQSEEGVAHQEVMLAYLKVLLVLAARRKQAASHGCSAAGADSRHPVLGPLSELIEQNYHRMHAPADYARRLNMTPKTLGRVVREHLGATLTDLIRARILTHAKWQLLHTLKPVKEVAREVGFADELYFSRLFKKATGVSPSFFREFETEIRGGSNLSMLSGTAPILPSSGQDDTSSN